MKKSVKYFIVAAAIIGVLAGLYYIFGFIRTPEIHGVVLDQETKQPAENAWITATLSLKIATIQGNVHVHPSVAPSHLRTNKEGRFVIPRQSFRQPLPPVAFGMDPIAFTLFVETIDDKQREVDLKPSLWKWKTEVTVYVKTTTMTEVQYNAYLQSLYSYCTIGRSGIEVPPVREGCDTWELDYAIVKHENFIKTLGQLDNSDKRIRYAGTLQNLGYLYKKRGDYKRALDTFVAGKEFDIQRKVNHRIREYEAQINELKQVLQK